jgi:leucyl aminopeptidase (aminopeptidase T)
MSEGTSNSTDYSVLARSVLTKNLKVRPGERVIIEGWPHTLAWANAFAREARRLNAQPMLLYQDEDSYWDSVDHGEGKNLGRIGAHEWAALSKTDVYVHMWNAADRIRFGALPEKTQSQLFAWNGEWYKAAKKAGLRGVRLEVGRPYPNLSKVYGVDEERWRKQIFDGTLVDPKELAARAKPIAERLRRGKRLRISDDHGTDLSLGLLRRAPRVLAGVIGLAERKSPFGAMMTLPSGIVSVALDETVADGTIVGNRTCYYDDGKATGAVFRFRHGRLVEHEFERGGERFDSPYKKASPGRDQPGRFSLGLNPALHDTPQIEDAELGAALVSVGTNQFVGGRNRSDFFGWVVNVGAQVEVDGRPLPI